VTREQLDAIRARVLTTYFNNGGFNGCFIDVTNLLAEVERLTADPLPAAAWMREVERAAFSRGVAAMREAAAKRCEVSPFFDKVTTVGLEYADAVRALPDPEDKP